MPKKIPDAQIFEAAISIMVREGFKGATTAAIAEAADVSEVTLFRRYGTKEGLLVAFLRHETETFGPTQAFDLTGDLFEDLTLVVERYGAFLARRSRLLPIVTGNLQNHPELEEVLNAAQKMVFAVVEVIVAYQTSGELEDEPPFSTVAALLGPLVLAGLLKDAPVHPPMPNAAEHVALFLRGRQTKEG